MSSTAIGPWALMKSLAFKFCFGLGLATISYYSFIEIKHWVSPESGAPSIERSSHSSFKDKVLALTHDGSGVNGAVDIKSYPYTFQSGPAVALPSATAHPGGFVEVLPSPADGSAVALPSPSPAEGLANESAENPNDSEVAPNGMEMPTPYAIPYAYDPGTSNSDSSESNRSNPRSDGKGESAGSSEASMQGGLNSAASNSGASGTGYVNSAAGAGLLSGQDISLLTSALHATFTSAATTAVGTVTVGSTATPGTSASVHTSRWTLSEGLRPDVGFSVTGSNVNNLVFRITFTLQDTSGADHQYSLNSTAIEAHAHSETRSGHPYRVFDFRLANTTLRSAPVVGEALRNIHVTISYDLSNPSTPTTGTESSLSFTRSQVSMCQTAWDFSTHALSNDPTVIVDEMPYLISIEKP